MKQTYLYFQPEYVSKFKCNGQICSAHCCKKWRIDVDKKTYKKWSHIKPKSESEKIIKNIFKNDDNKYIFKLDEKKRCPLLTEDNWCSVQKKYGEEYLSNVCVTYPRITYLLGNFFERSLSLTCPVVAAQVLLNDEPMVFEQIEVSEKIHSNLGRIGMNRAPVPQNLLNHIFSIQFAAISILQSRNLSIDGRLIMLGFFLDKLDEIISADKLEKIENLTAVYSSEKFLTDEAPDLIEIMNFDVKEHMKIIFGTFEALYGGNSNFVRDDQKLIDAFVDTFEITVNENNRISVDSVAKIYEQLDKFRKTFINHFSTVFENYLVNEFFLNLYPWKFQNSIIHNYGIFLTTYKMLELIALSFAVSNFKKDPKKIPPLSKIDLSAITMMFANNLDHYKVYAEKISEHLKDKDDVIFLMQSLLQR